MSARGSRSDCFNTQEIILGSFYACSTVVIVVLLWGRLSLNVICIDVEVGLCWLADTVRTEVDSPANQPANKNVSECPTICGLFQNNIFITSSL